MNPDDLLHSAPAIAKGAGALAAAIPFTAIVRRMLGSAADEVAEMWRETVALFRFSNSSCRPSYWLYLGFLIFHHDWP